MYEIKKLKWGKEKIKRPGDSISANTPFGSFCVTLIDDGGINLREEFNLYWSYCFDEYYNEDREICYTIKEGKEKAQKYWEELLKKCLKKVK